MTTAPAVKVRRTELGRLAVLKEGNVLFDVPFHEAKRLARDPAVAEDVREALREVAQWLP